MINGDAFFNNSKKKMFYSFHRKNSFMITKIQPVGLTKAKCVLEFVLANAGQSFVVRKNNNNALRRCKYQILLLDSLLYSTFLYIGMYHRL